MCEMSTHLVIDTVKIGELEDEISRAAARLDALLEVLDEALRQLDEQWSGEAHSRFRQRFAEWRAGSADLREHLQLLGGVVGTARDNYTAARAVNEQIWTGR
jgi:6 kDa early secretory antigenic target